MSSTCDGLELCCIFILVFVASSTFSSAQLSNYFKVSSTFFSFFFKKVFLSLFPFSSHSLTFLFPLRFASSFFFSYFSFVLFQVLFSCFFPSRFPLVPYLFDFFILLFWGCFLPKHWTVFVILKILTFLLVVIPFLVPLTYWVSCLFKSN